MKKFSKIFLSAVGTLLCSVLLVGCIGGGTTGKYKLLAKAAHVTALAYDERQEENLVSLLESAELFAAKLSPAVYENRKSNGNYVLSPLSVYMALALAGQCGSPVVREEIAAAFNVDFDFLTANFKNLFRSLFNKETDDKGKTTDITQFTNSIWLRDDVDPKSECLDVLSKNFFCSTYSADFEYDNKNANLAIKNFLKKQTNGLIDVNLELPETTLFALINTLYLKALWNEYGKDLSFTKDTYDFTNYDNSKKQLRLLEPNYHGGKVIRNERYSTFYETTNGRTRIYFIVPNDGYTVDDVFNEATLNEVRNTEFIYRDEEKRERYYGRCLFPEFSASIDTYVNEVLANEFGIRTMFDDSEARFTNLTDHYAYAKPIRHMAKLIVNKKGIEGAAATVIPSVGAAPPEVWTDIYDTLVVDKAFAYVVTNSDRSTLFSGVIQKV